MCVICGRAFKRKPIERIKDYTKRLCCDNQCWRLFVSLSNHWKKQNTAENNGQWKGDNVSKGSALHAWVRRHLLKPDICPFCNRQIKLELCNISKEYNPETYTRDFKNWFYACHRCHMTTDGRLNKWISRNKVPSKLSRMKMSASQKKRLASKVWVLMRKERRKSIEERRCIICGNSTFLNKKTNTWSLFKKNDGFQCHNCYQRDQYQDMKRRSPLVEQELLKKI
jgi:hypothetical protein